LSLFLLAKQRVIRIDEIFKLIKPDSNIRNDIKVAWVLNERKVQRGSPGRNAPKERLTDWFALESVSRNTRPDSL